MDVLRAKFKREVVRGPQTAVNIAKQIKRAIKDSKQAAEYLSKKFSSQNNRLFKQLYNFANNYIEYDQEPASLQTAKTLPRILADKKGDCKHYTILIGSILKAKNKKFVLRMISQNYFDKEPTHIYIVAYDKQGNEIIIDPCTFLFDNEARYNYKYDLKI